MQAYNNTDQALHLLTQYLAKAGRSFVSKRDDDSHTNLYFDPIGQQIFTHPFTGSGLNLSFSLAKQQFEWIDENRQTAPIAKIEGQTTEQLEDEIATALEKAGLDSVKYREPLHYEIPAYEWNGIYTPLDKGHLGTWQYYRRLANQVGAALLGYLGVEGQPRIWPHHFDTGTYGVVGNRIGIGYGLAIQDTVVGAPYFYLSGYAQQGKLDFSSLASLNIGQWKITDGWKGAVLPLTELPPRHAMRVILQFVQEATDWYLQADQT